MTIKPERTDSPRGPAEQWGCRETPDSGFVLFWPHRDAPLVADIGRAVSSWVGSVDGVPLEPISTVADAKWSVRLGVPGVSSPLVIWAQSAAALEPTGSEALDRAIGNCPWVVCAQCALTPGEAADEYFMLVSLLASLAPETPAILDMVTAECIVQRTLHDDFLAADAVPSESHLYSKARYESPDYRTTVMLATHGLVRCGLPELEVLDVPTNRQREAAVLLDIAAGLALEVGLPAPDGDFEIGLDLRVRMRRPAEVVAALPPKAPGSAKWRKAAEQSAFDALLPRATLCDGETGAPCPLALIEALAIGEAPVFVCHAARRQLIVRARRSYPTFAMAFASLAADGHPRWQSVAQRAFLVQAADVEEASDDGASPPGTQRWWRVEGIEGDSVRVRPTEGDGPMRRLARGEVLDWRADLPVPGGPFGPWDPEELLSAVDSLREREAEA